MGKVSDDLTPEQWDALKALRNPQGSADSVNAGALGALVRLGLVDFAGSVPTMTAAGRAVLVRGSSRLLDVAA